MEKQAIINNIKNYFSQQEVVVFAYLFGSFLKGDVFRDIDIAIYTRSSIDLLQLGRLKTEVESQINREVDLIELNNLPNRNPVLAYDIVTFGHLFLEKDEEEHIRYKKKAWMYYFDTSRLREMMDRSFTERLESNKIGQREYEE